MKCKSAATDSFQEGGLECCSSSQENCDVFRGFQGWAQTIQGVAAGQTPNPCRASHICTGRLIPPKLLCMGWIPENGPKWLLLLSLLLASATSEAVLPREEPAGEQLSGMRLFRRCHTHLTGTTPKRGSTLFNSVAKGEADPIDACLRILERTQLNSQGLVTWIESSNPLKQPGSEETSTARAVLRTFNDFHRSWFPTDDFTNSIPQGVDYKGTQRIFDEQEPALYVTHALLGGNVPYSSITTASEGMEALRSNGSVSLENQQTVIGTKVVDGKVVPEYGMMQPPNSENIGVQTGELQGVRPISMSPAKAAAKLRFKVQPDREIPLQYHYGGGILGNIPYLMHTLGLPLDTGTDGGKTVARRHGRAVYKDLLCRDIPAIRELDAISFVQKNPTSSTPAFRTSANCMSCHASIDGLAGTTRHLHWTYIGDWNNSLGLYPSLPDYPAEAVIGQVDQDPYFQRRPTTGRVVYRSFDGTLINAPVSNPQSAGELFAEKNDLYVCAAKKYFHYFTGIQVSLQDEGNPASVRLSEAEKSYRQTVIQLGLDLKSHQSLKKLVKSILELPLYQRRSQRDRFIDSNQGDEP